MYPSSPCRRQGAKPIQEAGLETELEAGMSDTAPLRAEAPGLSFTGLLGLRAVTWVGVLGEAGQGH